MERLSDETLALIDSWAKKRGMVLFIDTEGCLSVYPKYRKGKANPNIALLQEMLGGHTPEMKMFLIRTTVGEE